MEVGSAGDLRPGDPERLGGYVLTGRLGEGGQGMVYLGRGQDGGPVAIKLLHQDLTGNERARARFLREVEVAKQVRSFCTARIIDVDVEDDRPYIVSEFVDGLSLRAQVEREGPLSGGTLERLAIGTATALVVIHQADVVHRDLKPGNVLLGPDGPRVIDFGIAKPLDSAVTVSSRVLGTPAFMAPEQLRGKGVARPADIFAWASTIVYAATGAPPFGQDTIPAVINRILHEEPELGAIDEPLRSLLVRCLGKDPDGRPDARQVLMALLGQDTLPQGTGVPAAAAFEQDPATEVLRTGRGDGTIAAVPVGGVPLDRTVSTPAVSRAAVFEPLRERLRRLNRRQWAAGGGLVAALVTAMAFGVVAMLGGESATQMGNRTPPNPATTSPSPSSTSRPLVRPSDNEPTGEPTGYPVRTYRATPTERATGLPSATPTYSSSPRPTRSHTGKPTDTTTKNPPKPIDPTP